MSEINNESNEDNGEIESGKAKFLIDIFHVSLGEHSVARVINNIKYLVSFLS